MTNRTHHQDRVLKAKISQGARPPSMRPPPSPKPRPWPSWKDLQGRPTKGDDPHGHDRNRFGVTRLTHAPRGPNEWHAHVTTATAIRDEITVHRHDDTGNVEHWPGSKLVPKWRLDKLTEFTAQVLAATIGENQTTTNTEEYNQ